jgi:sphingomyelin phosphodiesterase acid-like 3
MPPRTSSPLKRLARFAFCWSLFCAHLPAQRPAPVHGPARIRPAVSPDTIPALFLSDIHFDPFLDPAKAAALNSAPAADWPRILAGPRGTALPPAEQFAFQACSNQTDTSYALWQSTLAQFKKTPAPRFVVISGDLLAHQLDCKYKALVRGATAASYLDFTLKTARYVLTTLHATLPEAPIYTTLGNNDSGCTDYALDAQHDPFLAGIAPLVAEAAELTGASRTSAEHDFAALGAYNAPLAALPHTRILSLDDLYLSAKYSTCSGAYDGAPAANSIAWLKTQLDLARAAHEQVWFVSHIPPGVDLYATARKLTNVCGGVAPTMFLSSEELAQTLAAYSDVVRLALFGHTHDDELRLLTPTDIASRPEAMQRTTNNAQRTTSEGVPLKIVASITPVHGNRPSFTLARVDPANATLMDYSVMMASNPAVTPITWSREYTYSATYHKPAFNPASLTALIADFQADLGDKSSASQAYIRNYFPAEPAAATANAAVISSAWQPYACSLNHDSPKSFAACTCGK